DSFRSNAPERLAHSAFRAACHAAKALGEDLGVAVSTNCADLGCNRARGSTGVGLHSIAEWSLINQVLFIQGDDLAVGTAGKPADGVDVAAFRYEADGAVTKREVGAAAMAAAKCLWGRPIDDGIAVVKAPHDVADISGSIA